MLIDAKQVAKVMPSGAWRCELRDGCLVSWRDGVWVTRPVGDFAGRVALPPQFGKVIKQLSGTVELEYTDTHIRIACLVLETGIAVPDVPLTVVGVAEFDAETLATAVRVTTFAVNAQYPGVYIGENGDTWVATDGERMTVYPCGPSPTCCVPVLALTEATKLREDVTIGLLDDVVSFTSEVGTVVSRCHVAVVPPWRNVVARHFTHSEEFAVDGLLQTAKLAKAGDTHITINGVKLSGSYVTDILQAAKRTKVTVHTGKHADPVKFDFGSWQHVITPMV